MTEKTILLEGISPVEFLGPENRNIKKIAAAFPSAKIIARGDEIKLIGPSKEITNVNDLIQLLLSHYNRFGNLSLENVSDYLSMEKRNDLPKSNATTTEDNGAILYGNRGIIIRPKSDNQKALVQSIEENDVTFAIGPAGTGKTYMAVAMAVNALKNKTIRKIIITRPVVEAGESLGFLPGDLKEKVDPYLRPIYDALEDMLPSEKLAAYLENNTIEIAPLAYMRGRTLNDAFVLLDEAQNTTSMQLKMFLTRLGKKSKMIVTGDTSQIDLPRANQSGLREALELLSGINGIGIVPLSGIDVVRHKIVKKIIAAYENKQ